MYRVERVKIKDMPWYSCTMVPVVLYPGMQQKAPRCTRNTTFDHTLACKFRTFYRHVAHQPNRIACATIPLL